MPQHSLKRFRRARSQRAFRRPRTRTKYGYDLNGNVISRNSSAIGWTSYNYPSGVSTSTESATFDYGPDRQRWRMVYSGPTGTETTYYATPKFEVVVTSAGTDYRHYLFANGRPVTVISRTTAGSVNVRSLLLDHQGSISTIVADATGTSYATESFAAYGNRREASTWSGTPTSTELATMNGVTREGYTFQTVLGSMGLNHMNGRIEDAVTGRFLSADPRGTSRGNTQSWNRYSYVNNNPLAFTDPTGFAVVPYCHDWCPGANWHPAPFAFSSWGNSSSSLEGMVGTNSTYGTNNTIDLAALTASLNANSAVQNTAVTDALSNYNSASASAAVGENLEASMGVSAAVDQALTNSDFNNLSTVVVTASAIGAPNPTAANNAMSVESGLFSDNQHGVSQGAPQSTSPGIIQKSTAAGALAGSTGGMYYGFQVARVAGSAAATELAEEGPIWVGMGVLDAYSGLMMQGLKFGGIGGAAIGLSLGILIYGFENPQPINQNWQVPYSSVAASP